MQVTSYLQKSQIKKNIIQAYKRLLHQCTLTKITQLWAKQGLTLIMWWLRGLLLSHGVSLSHHWCRVGDRSCTRGGTGQGQINSCNRIKAEKLQYIASYLWTCICGLIEAHAHTYTAWQRHACMHNVYVCAPTHNITANLQVHTLTHIDSFWLFNDLGSHMSSLHMQQIKSGYRVLHQEIVS